VNDDGFPDYEDNVVIEENVREEAYFSNPKSDE
jgi:hypothetical protein